MSILNPNITFSRKLTIYFEDFNSIKFPIHRCIVERISFYFFIFQSFHLQCYSFYSLHFSRGSLGVFRLAWIPCSTIKESWLCSVIKENYGVPKPNNYRLSCSVGQRPSSFLQLIPKFTSSFYMLITANIDNFQVEHKK